MKICGSHLGFWSLGTQVDSIVDLKPSRAVHMRRRAHTLASLQTAPPVQAAPSQLLGTWPQVSSSWELSNPRGEPRSPGELGPPVLLSRGPLITMTSWRTQAGVHG
ncbi:hypothetical protein H1C71_012122, partial [Ictidomys tridecemlineatus]